MISKITIGFSRPKNKILPIGSWLIRLYQGTSYSHTYIRFYSESLNRVLVYEAVGNAGVRFIGFNRWLKSAEELESFTIDAKKCNATTLLQNFVDEAGEDYGFMQNVGLVVANLFGWRKNPFRKGKNCSEKVGRFLLSEGYEIHKSLDLLTPKDIYDILKRNTLIQCSKKEL